MDCNKNEHNYLIRLNEVKKTLLPFNIFNMRLDAHYLEKLSLRIYSDFLETYSFELHCIICKSISAAFMAKSQIINCI